MFEEEEKEAKENEEPENMQWISIPLQIGDPILWRHLANDVLVMFEKKI